RLSLRGTGNEAYNSQADTACAAIKSGEELSEALSRCGVFPRDFIDILANAEEGGRVPEVMRHQAEHYEEEAHLRLKILTNVPSWAVYAIVAGILVFMILSIAMKAYINPLNNMLKGL